MDSLRLVDDVRALGANVDQRLEQSIDNLIEQGLGGELLTAELASLAAERPQHHGPARYLDYFALALGLMGDASADAASAIERMCRIPSWDHNEPVLANAESALGDYAGWIGHVIFGSRLPNLALEEPSPEIIAWFRDTLPAVRADIEKCSGAMAEELAEFFRVMVVTETGPDDSFGSASTLAALRLILVNAPASGTQVQLFGTVVHELTHMVLHAASGDERLSLNDEAARFTSPLRSQPRPMEGVVHATIVCARMAAMYRRWSSLPGAPAAELHPLADELLTRFDDGATVVDGSATLSTGGGELWHRATLIADQAR